MMMIMIMITQFTRLFDMSKHETNEITIMNNQIQCTTSISMEQN